MAQTKNLLSRIGSMLYVSIVVPGILVTHSAHAASVYGGGGIYEGIANAVGLGGISSISSIRQLIVVIINFILDILLLLAVGAIIVAGVYLITSNGEEGQKDKAKKIILYAVAGILVALFSRVIVLFVNSIFS